MKPKIIVAICGASGSIYGIRLLKSLLERPIDVRLIISSAGEAVMRHETDYTAPMIRFLRKEGVQIHPDAVLEQYEPDNLFAQPASGSFHHNGMAVVPCSMKTMGSIAAGISGNLIHRSADVCLKERRPLILVPRETPLSLIHLKNMQRVAEAGAVIMPASPSFYFQPQSVHELVDTVVARILDHLGIEHHLVKQWGE
ncbi:MAG: UbiX family flavin prenyltransferase [Desulfobacteraceae bacterium]|nr:MAG: UbiX family flavin prenyltransferase [Desulfobacteraceae bacterium]